MGEMFSERKLVTSDVSLQLFGDAAVVEFYWQFDAKFRADGSPITTKGRESQVFYKSPTKGWQLVHVHYSNMPVTGDRVGF